MAPSENSVVLFNPSNQPLDGRSMWWELPREMRDTILKKAYARGKNLKVIPKHGWEGKQRFETRKNHADGREIAPSAFVHFVDRFLVDKTFAKEAYEAFFAATNYNSSVGLNPFVFFYGPQKTFDKLQVLAVNFKDLVNYADNIGKGEPTLKQLTVVVKYGRFKPLWNPWMLDDGIHLMSTILTEAMVERRGDFRLQRWVPEVGRQSFDDNVEVAIETLNRSLMRPKGTEEVKATGKPERVVNKITPRFEVRGAYVVTGKVILTDDNDIDGRVFDDTKDGDEWVARANKRL